MQKLYIIGNGFDSAHELPTAYKDFRTYILELYPDATSNYFIPESALMPKGDEEYDEEEVAGYIVNIIDSCQDGYWSELESYLGSDIYDAFIEDLSYVDMDDDDCFRAVYANEDMSQHISNTFVGVKTLFADWVKTRLNSFDFSDIQKKEIASVIDSKGLFLSFNYTKTLELGYGIDKKQVCHIHGSVDSSSDEIIMGHGDDGPITENFSTMGTEVSFGELKRSLRKDTSRIITQNSDFFKKLTHVKEIYSYGFSFGKVDLVYIEEICKHLNSSEVTWYVNMYDAKINSSYIEIIKQYGFQVEVESRW